MALDCDKRYIGIYKGRPSRPGERIWRERTGSSSPPSPPPSPTPGNRPTPDSGRTNIKHLGSDYCKPSRKCGLCEGDCDVSTLTCGSEDLLSQFIRRRAAVSRCSCLLTVVFLDIRHRMTTIVKEISYVNKEIRTKVSTVVEEVVQIDLVRFFALTVAASRAPLLPRNSNHYLLLYLYSW